jgi:hypothetical protein
MDFEPDRHSSDQVRTNDNYTNTITGGFEMEAEPLTDSGRMRRSEISSPCNEKGRINHADNEFTRNNRIT